MKNNFYNYFVLLFIGLFFNLESLSAQIVLNEKNIDWSEYTRMGDVFFVSMKNGKKLPPNDYELRILNTQDATVLFFNVPKLSNFGDSVILIKSGLGLKSKLILEDNVIVGVFEEHKDMRNEQYLSNDTVYQKTFSVDGKYLSNKILINDELLFEKTYYDHYGDSVVKINNAHAGISMHYTNGIIGGKTQEKNLAKGVYKIETIYSKKGAMKQETIHYFNGDTRIINPDGSYTHKSYDDDNLITIIKRFDKKGKLLSTEKRDTILVPSPSIK